MKKLFLQLMNAYQRMMMGRYGSDQLNFFLIIVSFIISLLNSIFFKNNQILNIISYMLLLGAILRSLSKKIAQRRKENRLYMKWTKWFKTRFTIIKGNLTDKEHRYYICPQCNKKVRVPSGRGKISITCPNCRHEFSKRS